MRSHRATHNLVAVSANAREAAINTPQALDTSMLVDLTDVANLVPRRESNSGELTGKEEADTIYDLGRTSEATLNFSKAQPQHFAFLLAYGLGLVATTPAGSGYLHTIRPMDGDLDLERSNPSFTLAQRLGKTVAKRRFASMFVDQVTATFAADEWVKISGVLKGTGRSDGSISEETIQAAANAASLNLAASGVAGVTAQERLDNVQRIRAELTPGVWTEVACSAVSADTPASISIAPPGATADLIAYKVLHAPTEAAWMAFPPRVVESPMRLAQMTLVLGGSWDGEAFSGGREVKADFKSLEWSLSNNLQVEFLPGAGGAYASRGFRDGRVQTVALNRELREFILQQAVEAGEYLGLRLLVQGAEFEPGQAYSVEIVWPKLGVLKAPLSVDGKRLAEAGDLSVLEHDVHGSVIVKVKNLVAAYAA